MRVFAIPALATLLGGCALSWVDRAGPDAESTPGRTVVEGRINYVIDGVQKTPYGGFKPAWPAPRMTMVSLADGRPLASPLVEKEDGAFRWTLAPGAYVVTRIGFGTYVDDTYLSWPGVVLCVPALERGALYAGHLQLRGTTTTEEIALSSGTTHRSTRIEYDLVVVDEGARSAAKRLMQVREDLPVGERLAEAFRRDPEALAESACGEAERAPRRP